MRNCCFCKIAMFSNIHNCNCIAYLKFKASVIKKRNECISCLDSFTQYLKTQELCKLKALAEKETDINLSHIRSKHNIICIILKHYITNDNENIYKELDSVYREQIKFQLQQRMLEPVIILNQDQEDPIIWYLDDQPDNEIYLNFKNIQCIKTQLTNENENIDCAICLNTINPCKKIILNCNHSFCVDCIKMQIETSNNHVCSLCRSHIEYCCLQSEQ